MLRKATICAAVALIGTLAELDTKSLGGALFVSAVAVVVLTVMTRTKEEQR